MIDIHNLHPPISDLPPIPSPQGSSSDRLRLTTPPLSPFLDSDERFGNNSRNSPTCDTSQLLWALKLGSGNAANNNNKIRIQFKPRQCFGSCNQAEISDADMLSAVQFDDKGEYLATGDRGGRVVIFKKGAAGKQKMSLNGKMVKPSDYKFYAEFLSHEPEFDYLKSLEIEERINKVKWLPERSRNALFLLSTNDKTIKLWKIRERGNSFVSMVMNPQQISEAVTPTATTTNSSSSMVFNDPVKHVTTSLSKFRLGNNSHCSSHGSMPRLELPRLRYGKPYVVANPSRVFANGYVYHISSIHPSSDGEHFIVSDDFRINLQNLNVTDCIFNIVDIKPIADEFTEVITCSIFLPNHSHTFLYSTSKGIIHVCDLRQSLKCASKSIMLKESNNSSDRSMSCMSDIITSISDVQSTKDGRYIASRDYMTVKLWDTHMGKEPIRTYGVHHHLRGQLKTLYNNGCIFDQFKVGFDGTGSYILTGSYNNLCNIYSLTGDCHTSIQVSKQPSRRIVGERKSSLSSMIYRNNTEQRTATTNIDYSKKIFNASWHPSEDTLAIGGQNKLFFYNGNRKKCS